MGEIALTGVTKRFAGDVQAVADVDLTITDGEFLVLVGPSGCGKSTLLRLIAGLESVSEGNIRLGDVDVTRLQPRHRDIAMVFQSYALYPHMSVFDNLTFGLKMRGVERAERERRVEEVARILGLSELLRRRPAALSGGQRQRVAMGRAMVREPKAFLMDEPLSNLDAKLRVTMRAELSRLHKRLGVTTVYVTHDQQEAMTLGDRVAVMRDGVIQQVGSPTELYYRPRNVFVAGFIGSPAMNLLRVEVSKAREIRLADLRLAVPDGVELPPDAREVVVGIRPSDFLPTEHLPPSAPRLRVEPAVVEALGPQTNLIFPLDATDVSADRIASSEQGAEDGALIMDDQRATITAQLHGHQVVRQGEHVELGINVERLYWFDPASGETLRTAGERTPEDPAMSVSGPVPGPSASPV